MCLAKVDARVVSVSVSMDVMPGWGGVEGCSELLLMLRNEGPASSSSRSNSINE